METILQDSEPLFGSWHITKKLNEGAGGQLYQIHKVDALGNDCYSALKVIRIPSSENEIKSLLAGGISEDDLEDYYQSVIDTASNEFTILSKLKGNTNIVSYEDHEIIKRDNPLRWVILIRMEEITPLLDYSLDHELSEEQILKMGIDICHGLSLCAKHNIIHRDIKPENIFVSENGDFKIGDFGIARIAEQTQTSLSRKGTYTYMAPEMFRGDPYTSNVDVYSLGLVMYRYLNNGRMPFMPDYPQSIVYEHNEKAFTERMSGHVMPEPAHGSARLQEIVLRACAYDSADRYETAEEMLADLEEFQREGSAGTGRAGAGTDHAGYGKTRSGKNNSTLSGTKDQRSFWKVHKKALVATLAVLFLCAVCAAGVMLRGVTGIDVAGVNVITANSNATNSTDGDTTDNTVDSNTTDDGIPDTIRSGDQNATIKLLIDDTVAPAYTVHPFWFRNTSIAFSSSEEDVFSVDENGVLTAVGVGDAILTMQARDYTRNIRVQVDPKVTKIKNVSDLEMNTGDTKKLKPKLKPSKYADEPVTYRSSDPAVVKVSKSGKLTALKAGTADITITAGGAVKTIRITVTEEAVPAASTGSYNSSGTAGYTNSGSNNSSGSTKSSNSSSSKSSGSGSSSGSSGGDYFGDDEYF